MPPEANIIARRIPIPLFGAGLVEAIDDETLLALEDPDDRNRDGISGRAAVIIDIGTGRSPVGRFGWKAQHATLLAFSADAYRNEMGITNELFPEELAFGISADQMKLLRSDFPIPKICRIARTRLRGIDNFEAFMKFLAPPPRGPIDDTRAGGRGGLRGDRLRVVPCAGAADGRRRRIRCFDRKVVPLFSDLLLHDVGTGDGIRRKPRLPQRSGRRRCGACGRRPLLHDGSAATMEEAIGAASRRGRARARATISSCALDRANLIAFLGSL